MAGKIYLVGGGCASPAFLTLQGKELLAQADAVVYDALTDPRLLDFAPQAVKISKGKRGHQSSAAQSEIHDSLLELSEKYKTIVRLQGGDPMVFGRGMEEIEFLRQHGVEAGVIPGISSVLGVPALEQFGLTKRGLADSFMVLTASSANENRTDEEWKTIAGFQGTLVFLMGMSRLETLSESLIKAGKSPETECVLLSSIAPGRTRSAKCHLSDLEQTRAREHLYSPGLVIIGGTASAFCKQKRPTVLLTGTNSLNQKIEERLPVRFQFQQVLEPVYDDFDVDLRRLLEWKPQWLVLTSAHGTDDLMHLLKEQQIDLRSLQNIRFALIGKQSAKRLAEYGIFADLIPEHASSQDLLAALCKELHPGDRVALLQSRQAIDVLYAGLKKFAAQQAALLSNPEPVQIIQKPLYSVSYQPVERFWLPQKALDDPDLAELLKGDVLVLGSREAARAVLHFDLLKQTRSIATISAEVADVVRAACQQAGIRILIAPSPDAKGIAACIEQAFPQADTGTDCPQTDQSTGPSIR